MLFVVKLQLFTMPTYIFLHLPLLLCPCICLHEANFSIPSLPLKIPINFFLSFPYGFNLSIYFCLLPQYSQHFSQNLYCSIHLILPTQGYILDLISDVVLHHKFHPSFPYHYDKIYNYLSIYFLLYPHHPKHTSHKIHLHCS